ncbi:bifunctional aspartate kinase/homoserine dehydrogenase I, partial [Bacteroidota bacterium]
ESGFKKELNEIKIENLVPLNARHGKSLEKFYSELCKNDHIYEKKMDIAHSKGNKLCYIAVFEKGLARCGIEEIGSSHSFYNLSGTDNIVAFTTKNYLSKPLVLKGPGAGPSNTAFGILSDVLRVSNYLA